MTTAIRDLLFPVAMTCLAFFRGSSPLPTSSWVTGSDPMRSLKSFEMSKDFIEDYNQFEEIFSTTIAQKVSTEKKNIQRCNYNPCSENQVSCDELSDSTGCSCPGFTLHNVIPEAPSLKAVSWNGSQVIIQWCAPYSYVTAYAVTVGGQETQEFRPDQRSGALGDIDHITEVCVVAKNAAGDSQGSCRMYHPRDRSLPLKLGLGGGALGFLLLLLLVVLLIRRYKRQKKQEASVSMRYTTGM